MESGWLPKTDILGLTKSVGQYQGVLHDFPMDSFYFRVVRGIPSKSLT